MSIKERWRDTQAYSLDVRDQARKLGFGIAATGWFFKTPRATFPPLVMAALAFTVGFFVVDLSQSLLGFYLRRRYLRRREWVRRLNHHPRPTPPDLEARFPDGIDRPTFVLFILKLALLGVAASLLTAEFVRRTSPEPDNPPSTSASAPNGPQ